MPLETITHPQYNLVRLKPGSLSPTELGQTIEVCHNLTADNPYLIINAYGVSVPDTKALQALEQLAERINEAGGSMIFSSCAAVLADLLENKGFTCIPSDDEAIDFMFMERIQNQFFGDDE